MSYFMICGGIVFAGIGLFAAFRVAGRDLHLAGYIACGAGGVIGGVCSARASSHVTLLQSAIAGALVVSSIFVLVKRTALGAVAFSLADDQILRGSLVLGGLAFGGGVAGALLGRVGRSDAPSTDPLRWTGMTVLITAGAFLVALIAMHLLLARRILQDPAFLVDVLAASPILSDDELCATFVLAVAGTGFVSGLVTQMVAPTRVVLVALVGVFLAMCGALYGLLAVAQSSDREALVAVLLLGGIASVLGLVGAVTGLVTRVRLSSAA